MENLDIIRDVAFREIGQRASHPFKEKGNKFHHGQRVAQSIKELAELILYRGDLAPVTVAAWLHDISNGEVSHKEHGKVGAGKVAEMIKGLCTDIELKQICHFIEVHDERDISVDTIELKLLQDADLLDHFGTQLIWCLFQAALKDDLSMSEAAGLILKNVERDMWHLDELHFDVSKKIFIEKMDFVRRFGERMLIEADGKFV